MNSFSCPCGKSTTITFGTHPPCDRCAECGKGLTSNARAVEASKHHMILPDSSDDEASCWWCHRTASQLIDDGVPEDLVEFSDRPPDKAPTAVEVPNKVMAATS